ncbi:type IV secretory system conjugative DNA transfer family protein [Novosphingobium aquae]|uniref:Type IV secretory system conjugative DNA transfer family protein n=1 Tax=Novosphingobium aquae TaxID=3133435 RepID=A0ABU8SBS1_9SPHN
MHRSALYRTEHRSLLMAHSYILGQSGVGKSTLLKQHIITAIAKGHGVFYLDPHGHDTDELLHYIPKARRNDVILFDPSREEVVAFNPLEDITNVPLAVSILLDTIKDAWGYGDMPTPTMDMYLYFSLSVLAETKETLVQLPRLLTDRAYRTGLTDIIKDDVVRDFWNVFDGMTGKEQRAEISSTLNKALMLIADPRVRRALGYQKSSFTCGDVVTGKIFLARLPQGQLSKGRVALLGSVLLSLMHQACLSRDGAVPFEFFLDECHLLAPSVVKEMLSGVRKFNVHLTLAHQYIDQLDKDYFSAVLGNCQSLTVFRTSMDDAKRLEDRFGVNQMSISFQELAPFTARQFPFSSRTPTLHVAPFDKAPYPRSLRDIEEHHRRSLWR